MVIYWIILGYIWPVLNYNSKTKSHRDEWIADSWSWHDFLSYRTTCFWVKKCKTNLTLKFHWKKYMINLSKNWHTFVSKGALSDAIKYSCTKVVQGCLAFLDRKFPLSSNRRCFCFVQLKFGSKRFVAPHPPPIKSRYVHLRGSAHM